MTPHTLVIQEPAFPAAQLFLLFHAAGADPQLMRPLGQRLAQQFAGAMVVAVAAPHPCASGAGLDWFTPSDAVAPVPADESTALPVFEACVRHWQRASGVSPSATALIGFAQGATLTLAASLSATPLAARFISLSGRYARLPESANDAITIHLLHGKTDTVMPYGYTVEAAHHLRDLGADVTAEVLPFIGHEIPPEFEDRVITLLTTHVPKRLWTDAMKASPQD